MKNNLEHYKGYELLIARLSDLIYQSEKYHKTMATNFLEENEVAIALKYLGKKYNYRLDGGHPKAIRNKIIFYVENDDIETCVCLRSRINTHFVKIEHRDVLGALLGLNIEKEMIGDIFVLDEEIIIYADASIADFICMNLVQVNRLKTSFVISEEIYEPEIKYEKMILTISSERIDNIVASICKINRDQSQKMIKAKLVSINHETIEDCSKLCNNNCTISIRRYGRYIYVGPIKKTKKDRLLVEVLKYV